MEEYIISSLNNALENYNLIFKNDEIKKNLLNISKSATDCIKDGNKLIFAGNGGSASDAQHLVADLVGRFEKERRGLPAISLVTNISSITAISNDYSFDDIFSRQVEALGNKGDIFFALSTSGNSKNIINALKIAKKKSLLTIGLTGIKKGIINSFCDYLIEIPSHNTARIQEGHILIGHILCGLIEKNFS